MPLAVKPIVRIFKYNGTSLPDPNPNGSIADVQAILANTHAEIATAAFDGPVTKGHTHEYTIVKSVGTKG
jgi:PRTRC genetic system protein C